MMFATKSATSLAYMLQKQSFITDLAFRRPCMLIPIVGELITALGLILCTYFDKWPMEVAGVTEALFPGLAGAFIELFKAQYSRPYLFRRMVYYVDGCF